VRSEHCVGYVKGRWSSLKGLRVSIKGQKGLQYATLWIIACINIHVFALHHERLGNIQRDSFYAKGKKYQKKARKLERRWQRERRRRAAQEENELDTQEDVDLLEGKIKREELKEELLVYLGIKAG
jgi:hypothetical protein